MVIVVIVVIGLIVGLVALQSQRTAQRQDDDARWQATYNDPAVRVNVEALLSGRAPSIDVLCRIQRNEWCCFAVPVEHLELRTVTTGTTYHGVRSSVRMMKGVRFSIGTSTQQRHTREALQVIDSGMLYVTNKRLIFTGAKRNVTLTAKSVLHVTPLRDGIEVEKTSGRNPIFRPLDGESETAIYLGAAAFWFCHSDELIAPLSKESPREVQENRCASDEAYVFEALIVPDWEFVDQYIDARGMPEPSAKNECIELMKQGRLLYLTHLYIVAIMETRQVHRGEQSFTLHHIVAGLVSELEEQLFGVKVEYSDDEVAEEGWVLDDDLIRMTAEELEHNLRTGRS